MGFWDGVNEQAVSGAKEAYPQFKAGENHARIASVEEAQSKNGKAMLKIAFADEDGGSIRYYIADGPYKLPNIKRLCLAFGIPLGETDARKWLNKRGTVVCKGEEWGGEKRLKVHFLKPASGEKEPHESGFKDKIPF